MVTLKSDTDHTNYGRVINAKVDNGKWKVLIRFESNEAPTEKWKSNSDIVPCLNYDWWHYFTMDNFFFAKRK